MFSSSLAPPITDSNDIGVSKMMLDLWTSFASSGLVLNIASLLKYS